MPLPDGWLMLCLTTTWMIQPQRPANAPWTLPGPPGAHQPVSLTQEPSPPRKPGEALHLVPPGGEAPPRREGLGLPPGLRF